MSDIKWELEDFSFRFTEPVLYKKIAQIEAKIGMHDLAEAPPKK